MDFSFFNTNKVVPVVVLNSIEETIPKLSALKGGGINVAEITFRTPCAPDCLALAVKTFPDMLVGVGTIINREQCVKALDLGAKFVVSPGFSKEVAEECISRDVPYIPGVITPTEVMMAKAAGLNVLKFFPASDFGGIKTMKALSAAFPDVRFVPTGGVGESNLHEFLGQKFVLGAGGSWMMKGTESDIETASRRVVEIAKEYI